MYISTPRLPDGPKSALLGSKLTWSIYPGMDILGKPVGCFWALVITADSTIMSGLLSDMAIKSLSRLFYRWSMLVYSRLIFEYVICVALYVICLLGHFAVSVSAWTVNNNNNNNIYLKSDIHKMFNRLYIKTYTNNITEIHV